MIRKYAEIFCWKNVSSFCNAKATHIFSAKNIRILYIESAKTKWPLTSSLSWRRFEQLGPEYFSTNQPAGTCMMVIRSRNSQLEYDLLTLSSRVSEMDSSIFWIWTGPLLTIRVWVKNENQNGKQCRPWWNGLLFAQVSILVCRAENVKNAFEN